MRFALLGNHPDGLALAAALRATGRHGLSAYSGPPRKSLDIKPVGDMEEILADPAVEAIIVAGRPGDRAVQLRRALQSERPVLCVHPADATADLAYEAAMLQQDTKQVLLPLLPEALHPGVLRLAELVRVANGPFGEVRLIELERWSPERVLIDTDPGGHKVSVPGWDVLRKLGGEVAEVSAFAPQEEIASDQPFLMSGRFEKGPLFRAAYLPGQAQQRWRLTVTGSRAEATLTFAHGWPGPACLSWHDPTGQLHEETWDNWDPWAALVEVFEAALTFQATAAVPQQENSGTAITAEKPVPRRPASELSWQDAVRCLELDVAVRRSVHYRRASAMEYQEASEEVGFKGTMTLVGCALFWGVVLLLIVSALMPSSAWKSYLTWAIGLVLAVFLGLQLLRGLIPHREAPKSSEDKPK